MNLEFHDSGNSVSLTHKERFAGSYDHNVRELTFIGSPAELSTEQRGALLGIFGSLPLDASYHNARSGCFLNEAVKTGLCDGLKRLRRACTHALRTSQKDPVYNRKL